MQCNCEKKRNTRTNKVRNWRHFYIDAKNLMFSIPIFFSAKNDWSQQDKSTYTEQHLLPFGRCAAVFFRFSVHLSTHLFHSIQFVWIKCQLHWVKHSAGEPKNKATSTCTPITFNSSSSSTNNITRTSCVGFEFLLRGKWTDRSHKYTSPLHSFTGCPSTF